MKGTLRWVKGGTASIVTIAGEIVTLRSTTPSPPGARLEATLEREGAPPLAIKLKSHGSKKTGDAFDLTARLLDASRDTRDALAATLDEEQEG